MVQLNCKLTACIRLNGTIKATLALWIMLKYTALLAMASDDLMAIESTAEWHSFGHNTRYILRALLYKKLRVSAYLESELWSLVFPSTGEDVAKFAVLESYRGRKFNDLFTDPNANNEALFLILKLFLKHAKVGDFCWSSARVVGTIGELEIEGVWN